MALPYAIATLIYGFNSRDEVLLLHRRRSPNAGLWSPPGGKLKQEVGESPHACACREAREETGMELLPGDLHLTGLVSESGYLGNSHWLMFLFEVRPRLRMLPPPHEEGEFAFVARADLEALPLPDTDRERIWPLFWSHRGGFFSAHCRCEPEGRNHWVIEESRPTRG